MRFIFIAVLFLGASCQAQPSPLQVKLGTITSKIVCASNPAQDYALFLPSSYTHEKKWPIIYAFDPRARGSVPLELAKAAAEKYGYIVAGSNQSANFNPQAQSDAVECLWRDTHERFSVDDSRIYVTGFSGGSRVAGMVAENCSAKICVAGVIAHGAGFASGTAPTRKVGFVYFATVGDLDFNYAEMVELRKSFDERGVPNRLRVFSGPHSWGPPETWTEAIEWLQIQAMKRGTIPKDAAFISAQLVQGGARASASESAGEEFAAWREYSKLVEDFRGLTNVTTVEQRVIALRDSKSVKDGLKRERDEVTRQNSLTDEIKKQYLQLSDPNENRVLIAEQMKSSIRNIRRHYDDEKDPWAKRIYKRSLSEMNAIVFEGAQGDRIAQRWLLAGTKAEIASESTENPTRGLFQAAKDYARGGDKGAALRSLKRAVESGLQDKDQILTAEEFVALRDNEAFKKIVASMPEKTPQ